MSTTVLQDRDVDLGSPVACAACPHPLEGHDAISQRYCRATVDAVHDRGCICPSR